MAENVVSKRKLLNWMEFISCNASENVLCVVFIFHTQTHYCHWGHSAFYESESDFTKRAKWFQGSILILQRTLFTHYQFETLAAIEFLNCHNGNALFHHWTHQGHCAFSSYEHSIRRIFKSLLVMQIFKCNFPRQKSIDSI